MGFGSAAKQSTHVMKMSALRVSFTRVRAHVGVNYKSWRINKIAWASITCGVGFWVEK